MATTKNKTNVYGKIFLKIEKHKVVMPKMEKLNLKKVLIIYKLIYTFRNYTKNHSWLPFTDIDKLYLQIYKEEQKAKKNWDNFEKGKSKVYFTDD